MRLLIKNARMIEWEEDIKKDILVSEGVISRIEDEITEDAEKTIDACGHYVLPGFIDMNCDICDPGYENKENIVSISNAAAKGGFTTITCQPLTNPVVDNKTVVNYIDAKSKKESKVNVKIYGSMTVEGKGQRLSEIGEMAQAGISAISDGGFSVLDSFLMRSIMEYSKMFQMPVITRCNDLALLKDGATDGGKASIIMGVKTMPKEAEEIIVARNLLLAKATGACLHITGVSTKNSVELIRYAKSNGVNVTSETHPHYFSLTDNDLTGYNTMFKVDPPLREWDDIKALRAGLLDGTIDVISSGHRPDTIESKSREFDLASTGISSIETAYVISHRALVQPGFLTFKQLIEKFTKNPANILSLEKKGSIKEGYDGDLIILADKEEQIIEPEKFSSKAKFSPYKGWKVRGKVLYTIVGGEIIYSHME